VDPALQVVFSCSDSMVVGVDSRRLRLGSNNINETRYGTVVKSDDLYKLSRD
jgi:hypothetical protein